MSLLLLLLLLFQGVRSMYSSRAQKRFNGTIILLLSRSKFISNIFHYTWLLNEKMTLAIQPQATCSFLQLEHLNTQT